MLILPNYVCNDPTLQSSGDVVHDIGEILNGDMENQFYGVIVTEWYYMVINPAYVDNNLPTRG